MLGGDDMAPDLVRYLKKADRKEATPKEKAALAPPRQGVHLRSAAAPLHPDYHGGAPRPPADDQQHGRRVEGRGEGGCGVGAAGRAERRAQSRQRA